MKGLQLDTLDGTVIDMGMQDCCVLKEPAGHCKQRLEFHDGAYSGSRQLINTACICSILDRISIIE